jgi:hypothetical protein
MLHQLKSKYWSNEDQSDQAELDYELDLNAFLALVELS